MHAHHELSPQHPHKMDTKPLCIWWMTQGAHAAALSSVPACFLSSGVVEPCVHNKLFLVTLFVN